MLGIIVFLGHTANIVLPFGLVILFIFKVQRYDFHVADYSHWWEVRVSLTNFNTNPYTDSEKTLWSLNLDSI